MPAQNYNTGDGLTPVTPARGAWLAYYPDHSGLAIFGDEVEALRYAVEHSMQIIFWEYGQDVTDATKRR